jgi:hypothetical protein
MKVYYCYPEMRLLYLYVLLLLANVVYAQVNLAYVQNLIFLLRRMYFIHLIIISNRIRRDSILYRTVYAPDRSSS